MTEKNKSGKGKFFLGALLGAAAGAIAGKVMSMRDEDKKACNCHEEDTSKESDDGDEA